MIDFFYYLLLKMFNTPFDFHAHGTGGWGDSIQFSFEIIYITNNSKCTCKIVLGIKPLNIAN
jgi:hypothetical protein